MYRPDNTSENVFSETTVVPFGKTLARHNLLLTRGLVSTLQVNVGLLCNQACHHCHLEAGPGRREEIMSAETADQVVSLAQRHRFSCIDITGGAPEMNSNLSDLLGKIAPLTPRLMLRSNLTALASDQQDFLIQLYKKHRVVVIASFPSLNENQAEAQRGSGVFRKSLAVLQKLNSLGYGQNGSGLELNLVSNPAGAFLPSSQEQAEKRFRLILKKKWALNFNRLYTFANVPLGRFHHWLKHSGNLDTYMQKLSSNFNPCAINGLMCRTILSVSWDGFLYDCDFNQAVDLYLGSRKTHISELSELPEPGSAIAVADHCYTCTAGSGFT